MKVPSIEYKYDAKKSISYEAKKKFKLWFLHEEWEYSSKKVNSLSCLEKVINYLVSRIRIRIPVCPVPRPLAFRTRITINVRGGSGTEMWVIFKEGQLQFMSRAVIIVSDPDSDPCLSGSLSISSPDP